MIYSGCERETNRERGRGSNECNKVQQQEQQQRQRVGNNNKNIKQNLDSLWPGALLFEVVQSGPIGCDGCERDSLLEGNPKET